ncbi:cation transporting ATPase C-terminal domain-containing protein, partial [Patescibacteria group bacterium]|nr:cation transporting ATPase C-terminal domain-containing protein [Patescibacteria group bacterium]
MSISTTILQIFTLLFAGVPLSLLIINKFFPGRTRDLSDITTICTDVIGTLTKKELVVKRLYFNEYKAKIKYKSSLIIIEDLKSKQSFESDKSFLKQDLAIQLASISSQLISHKKQVKNEQLINNFFRKCSIKKSNIEESYEILEKISQSSDKKISTIVAKNINSKEISSFNKGNAFSILQRCNRILINGKKIDLSPSLRTTIKNRIKRLNKQGQKVFAFSYKPLPLKKLTRYTESFVQNELIFLGFIGLGNPLNLDLRTQIEHIQNLGIKIYILSNIRERKAVAAGLELGIINKKYFEPLSSEDLKDIPDNKLEKMLANKKKDYIFTNLKEEDRTRILQILHKQKENIALITRNSNINFENFIPHLKENRTLKENQTKIIHHSIIAQIAKLCIVGTSLIIGTISALTISLIIVIELIINLPLQLALKQDNVEKSVLKKDYQRSRINIPRIATKGLFFGLIFSFLYLFTLSKYGWNLGDLIPKEGILTDKSHTIILALFVIAQTINAYNLRTKNKSFLKSKPQKNLYLIMLSIINILVLYLLTTLQATKSLLKLTEISQWGGLNLGNSNGYFYGTSNL